MEIVNFKDKTWQEIPDQDNPAMGHIKTKNLLVNQECIIICKGEYPRVANGGFVVLENPLQGDVIHRGVFWDSEIAEMFSELLAVRRDNLILRN